MMLRASIGGQGKSLNLSNVAQGEGLGSGVPHGDLLVGLVNAALGEDDERLNQARQAIIDTLGRGSLVDAAGVIATFTLQNRVADATGLPLDAPIEMATRSLRAELGVDKYSAAAYVETGGWARGLVAKLAERIALTLFRLVGWMRRSR